MTTASTVAADLPDAILLAANEGVSQAVTAWLDEGGGVDASSCADHGDTTMLTAAALGGQVALVRMLLQRGASVNLQSPNGLTALMAAPTTGRTTIVQALLDAKADASMHTTSGVSALSLADEKHTATAQLLWQHARQMTAEAKARAAALAAHSRLDGRSVLDGQPALMLAEQQKQGSGGAGPSSSSSTTGKQHAAPAPAPVPAPAPARGGAGASSSSSTGKQHAAPAPVPTPAPAPAVAGGGKKRARDADAPPKSSVVDLTNGQPATFIHIEVDAAAVPSKFRKGESMDLTGDSVDLTGNGNEAPADEAPAEASSPRRKDHGCAAPHAPAPASSLPPAAAAAAASAVTAAAIAAVQQRPAAAASAEAAGAEAAALPVRRRIDDFLSAPPPPAGWTWPAEGECIDVEVQVGGVDAWVTAEILSEILLNGTFLARINIPNLSDPWKVWFSWQDEGTDWRRKAAGTKGKGLVPAPALKAESPPASETPLPPSSAAAPPLPPPVGTAPENAAGWQCSKCTLRAGALNSIALDG